LEHIIHRFGLAMSTVPAGRNRSLLADLLTIRRRSFARVTAAATFRARMTHGRPQALHAARSRRRDRRPEGAPRAHALSRRAATRALVDRHQPRVSQVA